MYEKRKNHFFSFKRSNNLFTEKVSGFTLIELLTVVGIMAILFSVGYASYRSYQQRQAVISAARDLRSDLRLAQEYASAGNAVSGCSGLESYYLSRQGSTGYRIYGAFDSCGNQLVKDVSLGTKYKITGIAPNFTIYFYALGKGLCIKSGGACPNSTTSITITISSGSFSQNVVVNTGGEIK